MNKYRYLIIAIFSGLTVVSQSCTDLTEETFGDIPAEKFGSTQAQKNALIGPLYTSLSGYYGNWEDLNHTTDEMIVPTRGGDWDDGGKWRRLYQHKWDINNQQDDDLFNGKWEFIYGNISRITNTMNSGVADEQAKSELRALRAFYHYLALDAFGNVPIIDENTGLTPTQSSRTEVFNWVEKELKEVLPALSDAPAITYSRINQHVARTILAKMYLNAKVYTGTERYQDAIAQCDAIISSGDYSLNQAFFQNFTIQNENSPEIILAIPFHRTKNTGFNIEFKTLHYANKETYNLSGNPWNGFCTLAEFYNSFDNTDVRKKMWLVGPQYAIDGKTVLKDGDGTVEFTPEIPAIIMPAGRTAKNAGARSVKYEIQKNNTAADQDNDFVIYRYADVLMMRGEAKFRLGDVAGALPDFNEVRERASQPEYTAATLTLDEILAERGREFAWENLRRQDLIRFGKYTAPRKFKEASEEFRTLFPIPRKQLSLNPNLKQNPGY